RLRSSPATSGEIMAGKVLPSLGLIAVQQAVLLSLGGLLFGLHVRGPLLALVVVAVALALCLVAMGVALAAVCRTAQQLNTTSSLLAIGFSGLGGALAPISVLPSWVRPIAPATPGYWAMRGYRAVILNGSGLS